MRGDDDRDGNCKGIFTSSKPFVKGHTQQLGSHCCQPRWDFSCIFTYASMVFHYADAIIFWTGSVDVQGKKVQSNNGLEARIHQPLQSALVPPMKHLVLQQNHKELQQDSEDNSDVFFYRFGLGRSATTGRLWFSGTGRATRQPSLRNGQTLGLLCPLLSLLVIFGR